MENRRQGWHWLDLGVAALFVLLAANYVVADLMTMHGGTLAGGKVMIGRDFLNAWAGGQLTLQQRVGEIYSSNYMAALDALTGHNLSPHAFSYPPTALLFLWPLGLVGYIPALAMFLLATGAGFLLAARPYLARASVPLWSALLLPASLMNIWAGHYGFLFAALWLATFSAMDKKPLRAGGLLAVLTFKPHMGVVIPLLLLLRQRWQVITAAVAGTLAVVLASLLLWGTAPWAIYLRDTSSLQLHLLTKEHEFFFRMMPTPYMTFWVACGSLPLAIATQCVAAVAAVFILARATISRIAWLEIGLMAATATFLVLPYAFNYDMGVVGIAALMLLFDRARPLEPLGRALALMALGTPILVRFLDPWAVPILPAALIGFLWVQARAYGAFEAPAKREPALAAA